MRGIESCVLFFNVSAGDTGLVALLRHTRFISFKLITQWCRPALHSHKLSWPLNREAAWKHLALIQIYLVSEITLEWPWCKWSDYTAVTNVNHTVWIRPWSVAVLSKWWRWITNSIYFSSFYKMWQFISDTCLLLVIMNVTRLWWDCKVKTERRERESTRIQSWIIIWLCKFKIYQTSKFWSTWKEAGFSLLQHQLIHYSVIKCTRENFAHYCSKG